MSTKANLSKGRGAKPWACRKKIFLWSPGCRNICWRYIIFGI